MREAVLRKPAARHNLTIVGGRVVTLSGPTAAGKSTAIRRLLTLNDSSRMLTSVTDRAPRGDELEGEYEFVTTDEFHELEHLGEFAWWVAIHGNLYGTRRRDIVRAVNEIDKVHLAHVAPQTYKRAMPYVEDDIIIPIYILSPGDDLLRRRCFDRGGLSSAKIEERIVECRRWDEEARQSGVPFRFVQNEGEIEDLVESIITALSD